MVSWRTVAPALSVSLLTFARPAAAEEVNAFGRPLEIDVTNTSIFNRHFDNHNEVPGQPPTRVDDNYSEFIDRFNLQLSYWKFTAAARLDGYVASQFSASDIQKFVAQDFSNSQPTQQLQLTNEYLQELNTRYLDTFYPAKLWVGFQTPGVEVTAGDFYVQLGRGLVFSVRKIDELSIDTTVRGGKLVLDREFGPVHVDALAFAGEMNPIRIDETSGRRLNVMGNDPLFFGFPTGNAFDETQFNNTGQAVTYETVARPNYLEDAAYGGRFEIGSKQVLFGVNGAIVRRKEFDAQYLACQAANKDKAVAGVVVDQGLCEQQFPSFTAPDPPHGHDTIRNGSGSINVPNIAGHGDFYAEVAGQQLADAQVTSLTAPPAKDVSGYAIYVAASLRGGGLSLSLEGKHYRTFFPIPANVDLTPGTAANEFDNVFYSQPPTTQSIYFPIASGATPDTCVTGGRAVATYRFNPSASVFTWLGRYVSWTEAVSSNYDCASREPATTTQRSLSYETDTWDSAAGLELILDHGKSKASAYVGVIDDTMGDPRSGIGGITTDKFYQEEYLRYDLVAHIYGPYSIQMQGWHRHRYEPFTEAKDWLEGENYTALQWSPHVSAIFGFEYLDQDGCQPGDIHGPGKVGPPKNLCLFYNGGAQWRSHGSGGIAGQFFDTVNLFVGEQRGAIRCVSGVCRLFPPFSGAKLELVSRF